MFQFTVPHGDGTAVAGIDYRTVHDEAGLWKPRNGLGASDARRQTGGGQDELEASAALGPEGIHLLILACVCFHILMGFRKGWFQLGDTMRSVLGAVDWG